VYYGFERSIRMSYRHQGTSAMTYLKEGWTVSQIYT
jgi:hypothetical protein